MQPFRPRMYHLELRQFPHNAWRFNLSEQQMRSVAELWARGEPVVLGERRWSPHKATLTILEGPELELQELSMGRGWRAAQRHGEDVTARVMGPLAQQRAARAAVSSQFQPGGDGGDDPLTAGAHLATLLGPDPLRLLKAWGVAAASSEGLRPSEALAEAEEALERGERG